MKKYNILIPMAGEGSRFVDAGYETPKQLITINGIEMIDWSLNSVEKQDCNLIFAVRKEHIENFSMDSVLKDKYGDDIKIVVVDETTDGSVSTCLLAKEYINNDIPLFIYTLDVFFQPHFNPNSMPNDVDGFLLTFKSKKDSYSYVKLDKNGFVSKTAEKEVISDNAAVGLYGFKTGKMFIKYAEKMISENIRTKNEFYICPLYNLMIADDMKVTTRSVDKMYLVGTPSELNSFVLNNLNTFKSMSLFNMDSMKNGWFIGDFAPSVLKTNKFEVGYHTHKKNDETQNHYHKESTEINVIVRGKMIVNKKELKKGDIFVFEPYVVSEAEFLEDTELIVVRDSSKPNDKYKD